MSEEDITIKPSAMKSAATKPAETKPAETKPFHAPDYGVKNNFINECRANLYMCDKPLTTYPKLSAMEKKKQDKFEKAHNKEYAPSNLITTLKPEPEVPASKTPRSKTPEPEDYDSGDSDSEDSEVSKLQWCEMARKAVKEYHDAIERQRLEKINTEALEYRDAAIKEAREKGSEKMTIVRPRTPVRQQLESEGFVIREVSLGGLWAGTTTELAWAVPPPVSQPQPQEGDSPAPVSDQLPSSAVDQDAALYTSA